MVSFARLFISQSSVLVWRQTEASLAKMGEAGETGETGEAGEAHQRRV